MLVVALVDAESLVPEGLTVVLLVTVTGGACVPDVHPASNTLATAASASQRAALLRRRWRIEEDRR